MASSLRPFTQHLRYLYLGDRFFYCLAAVVVFSVIGFWYPALFFLAKVALLLLVGLTLVDTYLLYLAGRRVTAVRKPPEVLSLGDLLEVSIAIESRGDRALSVVLTDELPEQLQVRDQRLPFDLPAHGQRIVTYPVRPTTRGAYHFGAINLFLSTGIRLAQLRLRIPHEQMVAVYPSVVQMKRFSTSVHAAIPSAGRRQPRTLSKSYEFDQIKEYVRGDDLRSVNWKATARRGELMTNIYEIERAQRIYSVIDKGRTMLMPFAGLSLLDYAINASLALTNVVLRREDRAGLITFSDKLGDVVAADGKPDQLRRVMETLYRQQEREGESDYELLYYATRRFLPGRSLLLLFTNFESNYALDRVLPVLRRIARNHSLVVILFENTEISDLLHHPTPDTESVYLKSTARRYLQERQLMAARLRQNGVKVILTRPESLTGAVIDKYLELKGRGMI